MYSKQCTLSALRQRAFNYRDPNTFTANRTDRNNNAAISLLTGRSQFLAVQSTLQVPVLIKVQSHYHHHILMGFGLGLIADVLRVPWSTLGYLGVLSCILEYCGVLWCTLEYI